jgi:hypothetical protein
MRLKYKHVQKAGVENGRNRSCRKMQKMARAIGPEQYGAISFLDLFFSLEAFGGLDFEAS